MYFKNRILFAFAIQIVQILHPDLLVGGEVRVAVDEMAYVSEHQSHSEEDVKSDEKTCKQETYGPSEL